MEIRIRNTLIFLLCMLSFQSIISCRKRDDSDGRLPVIWYPSTWTVGDSTFVGRVLYLTTGGSQFPAYINVVDDTPVAKTVLHIDFAKLPTTDGRLRIVREPVAPDEIRLFAYGAFGNPNGYMSKPDPESEADIKFTNDKMTLNIRNALLTEFVSNDTAIIRLNASLEIRR